MADDPEDLRGLFDRLRPDHADPVKGGSNTAPGREYDDYGTTAHHAGRIRDALGGRIACDPASSDRDNRIILAEIYYTHDRSGLDPDNRWLSPSYLNPPAGQRTEFLERAAHEAERGCEMVVCVNQKHVCTLYFMDSIMKYVSAQHIPRTRTQFRHDGPDRSESPTDGCVFFYIGPNPMRFYESFARDAGLTAILTKPPISRPRGQAKIVRERY